jgi:hypothetical protein
MTVGGLDRGYRFSGRPGVPAIAVTVRVVNDSEATTGRENTASLSVRPRTVQGLVFEGRPGDAYAPIRWSA